MSCLEEGYRYCRTVIHFVVEVRQAHKTQANLGCVDQRRWAYDSVMLANSLVIAIRKVMQCRRRRGLPGSVALVEASHL
jgi:hypothetical protein